MYIHSPQPWHMFEQGCEVLFDQVLIKSVMVPRYLSVCNKNLVTSYRLKLLLTEPCMYVPTYTNVLWKLTASLNSFSLLLNFIFRFTGRWYSHWKESTERFRIMESIETWWTVMGFAMGKGIWKTCWITLINGLLMTCQQSGRAQCMENFTYISLHAYFL